MKFFVKRICILCFCLLLCLSGCGNKQNKTLAPSSSDISMLGYDGVLSQYSKIVKEIFSGNFEAEYNSSSKIFVSPDPVFEYEWGSMVIGVYQSTIYRENTSFGYILKDIVSNGIDELFLVTDDYTILAVFTSEHNSPKLLGAYWPRNRSVLLENGDLCVSGTSGAELSEYSIERLKGSKLEKVKIFGIDGDTYYENVDGERVLIDNARFEELRTLYCRDNNANVLQKEPIIKITSD